jgi:hypothetical protein
LEITDCDIQSESQDGRTPTPTSVLRSRRAIQVNIAIMRTFVELRRMLATHEALAHKLAELEQGYDEKFRVVFDAIRQLMTPPDNDRAPRRIGFSTDGE